MGLIAVGTVVGLAMGASGRGWGSLAFVLTGSVVAFGAGMGVYLRGIRPWMRGDPFPAGVQIVPVLVVAAGVVILVWFDGPVGGAVLAGVVGGLLFGNAWAIRVARENRGLVDQAEAAAARDRVEAAAEDTHRRPRPMPPTRTAAVGRVLRETVALERQRALAWLVATVLVSVAGVGLGAPEAVAFGVVLLGGLGLLWVLRRLWAAWLAHLDFTRATTSPRRAYVILLHDPAPRMIRPLLGVWSELPVVRGGRLPRPEQVYRCDEEQLDLQSFQGGAVVHEAWVDTGPRRTSKPRWVAADAGIALPHRRSLGRWYLGSLIRGERPDPPQPLTIRPPHPDSEASELSGDVGNFPAALGWRLAVLILVALVFAWII